MKLTGRGWYFLVGILSLSVGIILYVVTLAFDSMWGLVIPPLAIVVGVSCLAVYSSNEWEDKRLVLRG